MQDSINQFEKRKQDHIELALSPENQASECNALDQCHLIHEALPDLDFADIKIHTHRFNKSVPTPFIVSSMTAGHKHAAQINRNLMAACAEKGWAMGVGSQRRELFDNTAAFEWLPLRQDFPGVSLFSNFGIAQLLTVSPAQVQQLIDTLKADALIIHCNPLQEVIQPEGTPQFKGCWAALQSLVQQLSLPVVIKETGCGFSVATLQRLNDIGIAAVDVSGLGGTHWGRIEGHRATGNDVRNRTAATFRNWGINTVQSVKNALSINPDFEIWGSGGVRHGLDAARLLALGASTIGFARPMLEAALVSAEKVCELMNTIEYELRVAMFCTGSLTTDLLKEKVCL